MDVRSNLRKGRRPHQSQGGSSHLSNDLRHVGDASPSHGDQGYPVLWKGCSTVSGLEWEDVEALERDAATSEAHPSQGFPHGISVRSSTKRLDASAAPRSLVEREFAVVKTGKSPYHYTVVLPNPVTEQVAQRFNALFGRQKAK
jgi:hypothetical protein